MLWRESDGYASIAKVNTITKTVEKVNVMLRSQYCNTSAPDNTQQRD